MQYFYLLNSRANESKADLKAKIAQTTAGKKSSVEITSIDSKDPA